MAEIVFLLNKNANDYVFGVEVVFGLVGNSIISALCFKQELRRVPTFVFIGFIAAADSLGLLSIPLTNILGNVFDFFPIFTNLVWCKITFFLMLFSFQWSSFLLVKKYFYGYSKCLFF